MTYARPETNLAKAIIYLLTASLATTLMILFVKIAASQLPVDAILLSRFVITLLLVLPFLYLRRMDNSFLSTIKTKRIGLNIICSFAGLFSVLCYFYAAKYLSLADATVLFNTAPLFIPIITYFWGGFKIIHRLWWGMGLGFIGVLVILHPGKELFQLPAIVGLLSGILAGITYVGNRYLTYSEIPLRNMFYYFLIGTLIAIVIVFITQQQGFIYLLNAKLLLLLLGIGIFAFCFQFCLVTAAKHAPVRLTSSLLYSSVIFSLIADWIIWGVTPTLSSWLGIILIIAGAFLLMFLYPHNQDTVKS